jgi:nucleotide-binding universal stress UspA family protein
MDKVMARQIEKEFKTLKKHHFGELPEHITIDSYFKKGKAVKLILSLAKKSRHDLIALGTKGMTAVKNIFVGSVTKGLIKKSIYPLLIIPSDTTYTKIQNIALAIRGEHLENHDLFQVLKRILDKTHAKLHLIHVEEEDSDRDHNQKIQELFETYNYSYTILERGHVLDQVNSYCQEKNMDMLCLIHKHRGAMEHIFSESLSVKQLYMLEIPQLILIKN